jgi:hypothetical protein
MKSIDFLVQCNGDVTVSIEYDGTLSLEGYDQRFDRASQEFGYEPTTCHKIIEEWERGWYFKVITQHYFRFVDPQDIAKAMVAMAEHAGEFVMNDSLFDNAKQMQPRPFWQHGQAIQFLKNYAKTGDEMPATFIEACRNNVHIAGSQFFKVRDIAGSDYSDALSNAMIWLINPESPTYGLMDFWNFTEFLANSVLHVGAPGIDIESEKLWQLQCFIDIANP